MHQNIYEQRRSILNAAHEPTEEECDFTLDDDEDGDEEAAAAAATNATPAATPAATTTAEEGGDKALCEDLETKAKVEGEDGAPVPPAHGFTEDTKGIPEFWLTIFKNVDLLAEMLQDHDEPILKLLEDIKIKFEVEPMGFTLEFYFCENEFFNNKVLTKSYEMKCKPDEEDPFRFEGPEIIRCKVCFFCFYFLCILSNLLFLYLTISIYP